MIMFILLYLFRQKSFIISNYQLRLNLFKCLKYYTYNGEYVDSYKFGDQLTSSANMKISDVYLPDWQTAASATYLFTDLYAQEYWTPVLTNK